MFVMWLVFLYITDLCNSVRPIRSSRQVQPKALISAVAMHEVTLSITP